MIANTVLVQLTGGGGAIIVHKFGVKQRLPIALRSSTAALEAVRIGNESTIQHAKIRANAVSSSVKSTSI